ncbi:MAG: ubiquinol-cytochrome c reductase iron-sulfur subunit [Egibacteraceae bacterium]
MTIALILLATAAGLLALALWWIRRQNEAFGYANTGAKRVGAGCEIGQRLLMASAGEGGGGAGAGGSGGGVRPKRRKPSGPSRRAFLRNSMAIGWLGVLGGFGGATLAFLWPSLRGGFGAVIDVANVDDIVATIREEQRPYEFPQGRTYLVEYDPALDPTGEYAEITGGAPLMALYQVCVHLGCKVPFCEQSQWFECPCHGSKYNRWGEYRSGPAPRGLDRFAVEVEDGTLRVDTSQIIEISRQTSALEQPPEGPSCVDG